MVFIKSIKFKKGSTLYNIVVDEKTRKTYYIVSSTGCDMHGGIVLFEYVDQYFLLDIKLNIFKENYDEFVGSKFAFSGDDIVFSNGGYFIGARSNRENLVCPRVRDTSYIKLFGKYSVVFSGKNKDVYYERQQVIGWRKKIDILSVEIIEEGQQKLIQVLERDGNIIKRLIYNHTGNIRRGLDKRIVRFHENDRYSLIVCDDVSYIIDKNKYTVLTTNLDIPDEFEIKYKKYYGEIPGIGIFSYTNRNLFKPIEGIDITLDEYISFAYGITFNVKHVVNAGIYCDGRIKLLLSTKNLSMGILRLVDIEFDEQPDIYDANSVNLVYCNKNQEIFSYDYRSRTKKKLFDADGVVKKICIFEDNYAIAYQDNTMDIYDKNYQSYTRYNIEIKPNFMIGRIDRHIYMINGKSLYRIENDNIVEFDLYRFAVPKLGVKPAIFPVHIIDGTIIVISNCHIGGMICYIIDIISSKKGIYETGYKYYDAEQECEFVTKSKDIQFFNGYSVEIYKGKKVVYLYRYSPALIIPNADVRSSSKSSLKVI